MPSSVCARAGPWQTTLCLLQVVDLEGAAEHKGSVLGDGPDKPQPPQKMFESLLLAQMRHFSVQRPVWIESESAMVGLRDVPRCLWKVRGLTACLAVYSGACES